ncbi:MAG: SDR family NAD(P)-dependent oxidoreductase [Wenzhouxiangella sp.]|nr:SDR family NAD(P)-dependent oxidoreductase [Wenzhouxiangella sp.]
MIRPIASLFFYARFLNSFSTRGYRRAQANWEMLSPDFSNQTWLVSGATGGIGRYTALAANRHGARVIALGRNPDALATLKKEAASPRRLLPVEVDLSSIKAVARLASKPAISSRLVDVLVNNVGVLLNQHEVTDEGFERSFATNILGPYVLTETLRSAQRLAASGLIINVSSGGMYGTPLVGEEMNCTDPNRFDGMAAYARHKRAMVVLTRYWNTRWQGSPSVQVMHPGWVDTAGVQSALPWFRRTLKALLRNAEQGADTILWLAQQRPDPPIDGGIWLDRQCQPEHEFSFTKRARISEQALIDYLQQAAEVALSRGH